MYKRQSLVFTWENLDNAAGAYQKLVNRIAALSDAPQTLDEAEMKKLREGFTAALDNDLNTSLAITALYDALKAPVNDATKLAIVADYDRVLGLGLIDAAAKLRKKAEPEESDPRIDALLAERAAAKKARNFAEADRIRDMLKAEGITIIDTPQGAKWKRD